MKKAEKKLTEMLNTKSPSAIERYFENERLKNLPEIAAKLTIYVKSNMITQDAGVFSYYDRSLIDDIHQVNVRLPIFGNYDYAADYSYYIKRTDYLELDTQSNWRLFGIYKYNGEGLSLGDPEDLSKKDWNNGDIIFYFRGQDAITFRNYYWLINVGCYELPYMSLLHYLITDSFYIKKFRFTYSGLSDNQISVPFELLKFSTFGKNYADFISLNAFKNPAQKQNAIIDFPYADVMSKYLMWFYGISFDCVDYQFDLNIYYIDKSREEYKINIEQHRNKTGLSKFTGDDSNFFED